MHPGVKTCAKPATHAVPGAIHVIDCSRCRESDLIGFDIDFLSGTWAAAVGHNIANTTDECPTGRIAAPAFCHARSIT